MWHRWVRHGGGEVLEDVAQVGQAWGGAGTGGCGTGGSGMGGVGAGEHGTGVEGGGQDPRIQGSNRPL